VCAFLLSTNYREQEEESDDENVDDESVDVSTIAFQEDSLLASNYRELTLQVKSSRLDAVVSAGLGMPRRYISTAFSVGLASITYNTDQ